MKWIKYLTLSLVLFVSFSSCKQEFESYNDFIGRWQMSALYLNGGSVNMLPTAELFEPCFKGSTLEFTERLTFELITECEWMADKGDYTYDDSTIEAVGEQGTQHFDFIDGQLKMIIKNGDYTFDLRFEKQQHKSEYVVRISLEKENGSELYAPEGYSLQYYVKHGDSIRVEAAEISGYEVIGESAMTFKNVIEDKSVTFIYRVVTENKIKVELNLIDQNSMVITAPSDVQTEYWVNAGGTLYLKAPELETYVLISEPNEVTIHNIEADTVVTFQYEPQCDDPSVLLGTWHVLRIMNGTVDMTQTANMIYPCILESEMVFSVANHFELISTCSDLSSREAVYCLKNSLIRIDDSTNVEYMNYNSDGTLSMDYFFQGMTLTLYFSK